MKIQILCMVTGLLLVASCLGPDYVRLTSVPMKMGSKTFQIELARSPIERARGLMNRFTLPADHGMLLVQPQEKEIPIWMKDVFFPLDVVWLAEDGRVLHKETLEPCQPYYCPDYQPPVKAKYVLEVAAGQFPLNTGDRVEIPAISGDSLPSLRQDQ